MQTTAPQISIGHNVTIRITIRIISRYVLPILLGLGLGLAWWSQSTAWASPSLPQIEPTSSPELQGQTAPARLGQPWLDTQPDAPPAVNLYFFWTTTCPHCRAAVPFIENLQAETEWLVVHSYELAADPAHAAHYQELATSVGERAQYVPAFLFCEQMVVGFDTPAGTGAQLAAALESCYTDALAHHTATTTPAEPPVAAPVAEDAAASTAQWRAAPAAPPSTIDNGQTPVAAAPETSFTIPLIGTMAAQQFSLPALTVILAGLDAFNPCAFFVLLFLLSLVIHARSRTRMAVIGGIFVFFSGALYFVFMAAWLNVFLWLGELAWITLLAGMLAVTFGLLNMKDYFFFKRGPSLSIPVQAQPTLFARMRGLLQAGTWPALIGGTIVLAISANAYELLCTAGFPMVFTRVLTLHDLSTPAYYAYLLVYALIYMLPLAAIVAIFTVRFDARKLRENEGRILKLLSGSMMLLMGTVLIIAPAWMSRVEIAAGLLAAAGLLTFLIHRLLPPSAAAPPLRPAAKH